MTDDKGAWDLVPGEIVEEHHKGYLDTRNRNASQKQRDEKIYYTPCVLCGRVAFEIELFGCEECAAEGKALSPSDARKKNKELIENYQKDPTP